MNPPKNAFIRIISLEGGADFLFRKKIAGLSIFKRLLFTLQGAGIENFTILVQETLKFDRQQIESDIQNDFRFTSKIQWSNLNSTFLENDLSAVTPTLKTEYVLLIESNLITTTKLIKNFVAEAIKIPSGGTASLTNQLGQPDGIHLLPFSLLVKYLQLGIFEKPLTQITPTGLWCYREKLKSIKSIRLAEKNLLKEHKLHYNQAMDIWFNSLFSLKISSFLVKTPVTPNQITLFGLVIGLTSCFFFSQGNYWSNFIGGLLLIFTAIWDCCDGDVARLKFMESDFGDKLDTSCDNIINVFIFTGIVLGVAASKGLNYAIIPFFLLALGGCSIFYLIYFPKGGGKGSFFKNTPIYDVIKILASRNFIYIIFAFAILGKLDWFLWVAGIGSTIFAISIYRVKRKILFSKIN